MTQQYPIVNGPSIWRLSMALFDREKGPRKVTFSIEYPESGMPHMPVPERVTVTGVNQDKWDDESWNIEGDVVHVPPRSTKFHFSASYSTQTRKGWMEFHC